MKDRQVTMLFLYTALAFAFVCGLYGAIPFFGAPTLLQALGTTIGFAQSFLNNEGFTLYAENFGFPTPMPRSFGLSGVLVTQFFLWAGLEPIDSYTLMIVFWLAVAYFGAIQFCKFFKVSHISSVLLSVLWLIQPVVINHAGYSMLSLGFALLPTFLYSSFLIFNSAIDSRFSMINFLLFLFFCVVSIFMDGYTYMMFASAVSLLGLWLFFFSSSKKSNFIIYVLPVFFVGFGCSYMLYNFYLGSMSLGSSPIEFFRGWGLDVSFILIPTAGTNLIFDFLGLSVKRTSDIYFGDASVWITTYSLPLALFGLFGFWKFFKKSNLVAGFMIVSLFGFYMALGPSVKFFSVKPEVGIGESQAIGPLMSEEYAVIPTGNAVLSNKLPGFKSMRASYRWHGLFILGLWVGVIVLVQSQERRSQWLSIGISSLLILLIIPSPINKIEASVGYRNRALDIQDKLGASLDNTVKEGEVAAFLPYGNDLSINFFSSLYDFKALNVGGDKNLIMAKSEWPQEMVVANSSASVIDISSVAISLLLLDKVDLVILPYFDTMWAIHNWPDPLEGKGFALQISEELKKISVLDVEDFEFYSVVRKDEVLSETDESDISDFLRIYCTPPTCLKVNNVGTRVPSQVGDINSNGWTSAEEEGFLIFGPYVPMAINTYELRVYGQAKNISSSWVDVVSNSGTNTHARLPINSDLAERGILAEGDIKIESEANDLEVRIYVSTEDNVFVESYELLPK